MQAEFRKLMHDAAPRPSTAPDVEAMWERGRRQRISRALIAASFVVVVAAITWTVTQSGYVGRLLGHDRVGPAQDGNDEPGPSQASDVPSGTLYLENLCREVGSCSLTVVDLDAGTSRSVPVPELALGDAQFRIVRSGSKLVFRGSTSGSTGSDVETFTLNLDLEDPPQSIGESWYFVPSATEGRVWLAILDPESPETVRALEAVKEVTADGEVTVPHTTLPRGRWLSLVGAVEGALVFQSGGDDAGLEVWDPLDQEMVMRLPGPFPAATHGSMIAWCGQGCEELHITDVATGDDRTITPGTGFSFEETYYAAFSPDGSLLAVPVASEGRGPRQVALVDVAEGTATVIKGSELGEYYGSMTWSSSGDWVFFNAGRGRIMAYRPGSTEAEFLPVEIDDNFFGMAAS